MTPRPTLPLQTSLLLLAFVAFSHAEGFGRRPPPLSDRCTLDPRAFTGHHARDTCPLPMHNAAVVVQCDRPDGPSPAGPPGHCLLTSATFHNGRGISLISSPELLAAVVGTGALDDDEADTRRARPLGPQVSAPRGGDPACRVAELPGRGKGLVAARALRAGETFLVDRPVLLVATGFMEGLGAASSSSSSSRGRDMLQAAVDGLPPASREMVYGLERGRGGHGLVHDIFTINGCSLYLNDTTPHMALLPLVARVNHACDANSFYRFSQKTLEVEMVANRFIDYGEEITISYAFIGMPHDVRQRFLEQNWGFTCQCALCSAPAEAIAASDGRRMRIVELRREVKSPRALADPARAVEAARELLGLYNAEGMAPLKPDIYELMAVLHLEMGDTAQARRSARLGLKGRLEYYGEDSYHVARVRQLLMRIDEPREGR